MADIDLKASGPPENETLDPFELMPAHARFKLISRFLEQIENLKDSKALAAWATWAIPVTVGTVGFVASAIRLITSGAVSTFLSRYPNIFLILLVSIISINLVLVSQFFIRRSRNKTLRQMDTAAAFKILQFVDVCHIKSETRWDIIDRFWVKAINDNCRYFDLNFAWSADFDCLQIKLRNPSFKFEVKDSNKIGNKKLVIDLGSDFKKDHYEVIDIIFQVDTSNRNPAKPFISISVTSPKYPRFNTYLGIVLDKSVKISALYRQTYFTLIADRPFSSIPVRIEGKDHHFWPIKPVLGWKSCLKWEFMGR
ncbi:hypothetical protein [Novosphingobium sp.]|uniref:hypothetical protein n=1 Tax=Novosphingobium sp. TaxID=1874826 RepID=UPI003BA9234A